MSASLVGSEMCIRDRDWRSPIACVRVPRSGSPKPGNARSHAEHAPPGRPVSYTHLTLPTICSV
eukprot:9614889-Alexandrium_andersonii.AAC.1